MPRRTRGEREKKAFAEEEEDDEGKCYYRREGKGGNHLEKENVTIAGQERKGYSANRLWRAEMSNKKESEVSW